MGNKQNRLINQIKVKMKNHVALSADVINYYTEIDKIYSSIISLMKPSQKAINVKLICVGDGNVGKTDILLRYKTIISMLCGRERF